MMQLLSTLVTIVAGGASTYCVWLLQQNHSMKLKLKEKDLIIDETQDRNIDLLMTASKTSLRIHIIEYHDKYMEKGFMPLYVKDNLIEMYETYHSMGGNGAMTKFYNDLIQLPEKRKGESA